MDVERVLSERLEREVLAPARSAGLTLAPAGTSGLPTQQTTVKSPVGYWVLDQHVDDPSRDRKGKVWIPPAAQHRLVALDGAGCRFDLLWIAHQLPATWSPGEPLPDLAPPPARRVRDSDERLANGVRSLLRGMADAAKLLSVAAAAPLAAITMVGLDPLVLGGVCHPTVPAVQWVVLAQWEWE